MLCLATSLNIMKKVIRHRDKRKKKVEGQTVCVQSEVCVCIYMFLLPIGVTMACECVCEYVRGKIKGKAGKAHKKSKSSSL